MNAVLDVLAALGKIEWARCVGGDTPLRPPFIAWRFEKPVPKVEQDIVQAVESYVGATEWTVNKGGRNWVLEPLAFARFAKQFRVDVEAIARFGIEYPSETRTALTDAIALARHLRSSLSLT